MYKVFYYCTKIFLKFVISEANEKIAAKQRHKSKKKKRPSAASAA